MTEHSPGPWHEERSADGAYHQGIYDARARCVAVVWRSEQDPLPSEERRANARVIAASTELLMELAHLVRLLEPLEQEGGLKVPGIATLNGARAAIKKAVSA